MKKTRFFTAALFFWTVGIKDVPAAGVTFVVQPQDVSVLVGETATFTVQVSPVGSTTYKWVHNRTNGLASRNTTVPSVTWGPFTLADNGTTLYCYATVAGTYTGYSRNARITVREPTANLTVVVQPVDVVVNPGQTAQFSMEATGPDPKTYQWERNGVALEGETKTTLSVLADLSLDGSLYRCVITNPNESISTREALLTVPDAPRIIKQPVVPSAAVGETVVLTVEAESSTPMHFQWIKGAYVVGADSPILTLPDIKLIENGNPYYCHIINDKGSVDTVTVHLLVSDKPLKILTSPTNQTVFEGDVAHFSVAAEGPPPLRYQWQKNGEDIEGATNPAYQSPPTVMGDEGAVYSCRVMSDLSLVESAQAVLHINPPDAPPSFAVQPQSQNVRENQTVMLMAVAANKAPVQYQWKKDGVNLAESPQATGTRSPMLTLGNIQSEGEGLYTCVISNSLGSLESSAAKIAIQAEPDDLACVFELEDEMDLLEEEYHLDTAAIDPLGGYAYFVKNGFPGRVIRIRLSDFKKDATLDLSGNIDGIWTSVIDLVHGYLYVASNVTRVITKIRLSDFKEEAWIKADLAESPVEVAGLLSSAIDPVGGFAYFATDTSPARVVKIRLSDFKQVDRLVLNVGENMAWSIGLDTIHGFAYLPISVSALSPGAPSGPAEIIKIRLSDFTRVNTIQLDKAFFGPYIAGMDAGSDIIYLKTWGPPARLMKYRLSDFSLLGYVDIEAGLTVASLDLPHDAMYLSGWGGPPLTKKIRLSDMKEVATEQFLNSDKIPNSSVLDPLRNKLYIGAHMWPGHIYKVDVGCHPAQPADTNNNSKIEIFEATKYGACWKNPAAYADCPATIAIDYAVRAGTLWSASATGAYQYNSANTCPLCWEVKP